MTGAYGYASIWVFDAQGWLVARSSGALEPGTAIAEAAAVARGSQGPPHRPDRRGARPKNPQDLGARLAEDTGRLIGVITLTMAPEAGLFPLLSEEGVSTRTGETLLFRLDEGGDSTYRRHSATRRGG